MQASAPLSVLKGKAYLSFFLCRQHLDHSADVPRSIQSAVVRTSPVTSRLYLQSAVVCSRDHLSFHISSRDRTSAEGKDLAALCPRLPCQILQVESLMLRIIYLETVLIFLYLGFNSMSKYFTPLIGNT
ncbi:hypothetical protein DV515_00009104, partial [Chloebia gouldiae]